MQKRFVFTNVEKLIKPKRTLYMARPKMGIKVCMQQGDIYIVSLIANNFKGLIITNL